jgi:hypothetical protein
VSGGDGWEDGTSEVFPCSQNSTLRNLPDAENNETGSI